MSVSGLRDPRRDKINDFRRRRPGGIKHYRAVGHTLRDEVRTLKREASRKHRRRVKELLRAGRYDEMGPELKDFSRDLL